MIKKKKQSYEYSYAACRRYAWILDGQGNAVQKDDEEYHVTEPALVRDVYTPLAILWTPRKDVEWVVVLPFCARLGNRVLDLIHYFRFLEKFRSRL